MYYNKKIGDKIRQFRIKNNLSQMDLECIINASSGTISRIESGKVNPTKETIQAISNALKLNMIEKAYLYDIDLCQIINDDFVRFFNKIKSKENTEEDMWGKILSSF